MQHIRCIIIDDEPLARKGLKEYINDVDFLQLDSEFDNPIKAMKVLSEGNIQLIFLDIQMPKVTGLEFFKTLLHAPPVIFTSLLSAFIKKKSSLPLDGSSEVFLILTS